MKTMLDKCAVAGDITQAIDRRGAWSCAVTVIGGAENTAVKLQTADSADGEFTNFKTLISADEAEADQYKGFVLDLSGAGNFIKIVGATMATCVLGDCDHDVKTVAIKAGEIPSGSNATAYCWSFEQNGEERYIYFSFETAPENQEVFSAEKCIIAGQYYRVRFCSGFNKKYAKIADNSFSLTDKLSTVYTRASEYDFTLWEVNN